MSIVCRAALASSLVVLVTTASRAQDAPIAEAITDVDSLVGKGKIPEARRRLETTRGLTVPPELQIDLELAQTRLLVAAAAAYGRGEDCGFWTAEEAARISGGDQPRAKARDLWNLVLDQMSRAPTLPFRTRALQDPALEPLRATPGMRVTLWASWRRPPREVWKDLELRTGDAECDVIFNRHAGEEVPQPGYFMEDAHDWIKGPLAQQRAPADAWAFAWRCALLSPINEGGWPTRHAMLQRRELVTEALQVLSERAGASPAGFDAMCLVNLTIVAGEHERAKELIKTLQREGGFFYDVAVRHGHQMALRLLQGRRDDAALRALVDDLSDHRCGLAAPPAPATPAKPGRRRR